MTNKNLHSHYKLLKHLDRLISWKETGFAYPTLAKTAYTDNAGVLVETKKEMTMEVPKSGCAKSKTIKIPATTKCGKNPIIKDFTFSSFLESE